MIWLHQTIIPRPCHWSKALWAKWHTKADTNTRWWIVTPKVGLRYMPSKLVKFSRWRKDKRSLAQYVIVEEARNDKCDNATSSLNHWCMTSYSHWHHNNVLLSSAGWEGARLLSLLYFIDWKQKKAKVLSLHQKQDRAQILKLITHARWELCIQPPGRCKWSPKLRSFMYKVHFHLGRKD